jgi:hypothetical protein
MKNLIALLFFAQFISTNILLSQSGQVKQASDACPSWSKKQSKTSTDYAYLSKRSAAKDNSDFSKPKYQSIYAKNTTANKESKRGKASASSERIASKPVTAKKRSTTLPEEKNESSKTEREPFTEGNILKEESKKHEVIESNETISEPLAQNPSETTDTKNAEESKESGKSKEKVKTTAMLKKEKQAEATKSSRQKQQRKNIVNKIKAGPKNATDCPEF